MSVLADTSCNNTMNDDASPTDVLKAILYENISSLLRQCDDIRKAHNLIATS